MVFQDLFFSSNLAQQGWIILGMLKKAASGVLAILPCSRTKSMLRAPKWLRPCWTTVLIIPVDH
jgi:hypothetical protein